MNKKLMAVAVAGALSAPGLAVAQVGGSPGITLYGRLDSEIMSNKLACGTANLITSGPVSAAGIIMGNGDTTGALPNSWCAAALSNTTGTTSSTTIVRGGITYPQNACVTEATGSPTQFSRRVNNTI